MPYTMPKNRFGHSRLCLLSMLALGVACGDDVTASSETSPGTTPTSSNGADTTADSSSTSDDNPTTEASEDDSSGIPPESTSSTTTDGTTTNDTKDDATSTSSGVDTEDTDSSTTAAVESSTSTGTEEPQNCPYGVLNAPDVVSNSTLNQDSEFVSSCGGGGAPDYSYTLTAPADGFYIVRASSPDGVVNPILAVFDGNCGGPELDCNNDFGFGEDAEVGVQLTEGQIVTVVADGFALTGGTIDLSVTFFEGTCPDDDLGNTVPVVFTGDSTTSDNTVFASCGGDTAPDDTLTFTAPEAGVYAIDTAGSDYDTVLFLLDECGGNEIGCSDDVGADQTSHLNLLMEAGEEIVVVVDGAGLESGNYTVNIDRDVCPDITLPSVAPQTVSGSTVGELDASTGSCGGEGAPGVSYSFTAPEAGIYTIDTEGSGFDTVLYAIDGCGGPETACSNDVGVGNSSRINVTLAEGEEVLFVVDGDNGESGTFDINIELDMCPDFDLGSLSPQTVMGNTEAEVNSSTGSCGGGGAPDVAYTFTAPASGPYIFDTNGSDFDTVLYAFDGATCAGDSLECDDDDGDGTQSLMLLNLVQDQEITVVVDGFSNNSGDYVLNVTAPDCGNGVIEFGEVCDTDDLDGETCGDLGFPGGTLACDDACQLDSSGCDTCGDEVINGADACDGTAIGQFRCEDFGFEGGSLDCMDDCAAVDTDQCSDDVIVVCSSPGSAIDSVFPTTTDTITVTDTGTIADVDVFLNITHSYSGDLDVTLLADDLALSNEVSFDSCLGEDDVWAFFNDEGSAAAGDVCDVPIGVEGNLTPNQPLSVYDGNEASGSWTLSVTDDANLDNGTLNEWCLYITLE